jgi:hypothetical protein
VYTGPDADSRAAWTGLARVGVVVNTVQRAQQTSRQTRYYLTSPRPRPVAELAAGLRGHWGLENKWHRTRDGHFTQDTNGIRHRRAAVNRALFNTVALKYWLLPVNHAGSYAQRYVAQKFKRFLPVGPRT